MPDRRTQITIYLRDHHAALTGGCALAARAWRQNRDTPYEAGLESLAADFESELSELRNVMGAAKVTSAPAKVLAAVAGERIGRLKLNGSLTSYSPLARIVELEGLSAIVTVKLRMWEGIGRMAAGAAWGRAADLERLESRSHEQLAHLAELHHRACEEAW